MMKMPTECWGMSSEDVWEKSRFDERREIINLIGSVRTNNYEFAMIIQHIIDRIEKRSEEG